MTIENSKLAPKVEKAHEQGARFFDKLRSFMPIKALMLITALGIGVITADGAEAKSRKKTVSYSSVKKHEPRHKTVKSTPRQKAVAKAPQIKHSSAHKLPPVLKGKPVTKSEIIVAKFHPDKIASKFYTSEQGKAKGTPLVVAYEYTKTGETFRPFKTREDIEIALKKGELVRVVDTKYYYVDPNMGIEADPEYANSYKVLRPYAKDFLDTKVAILFYQKWGKRLKLTGLTRSEEYVEDLRKVEPNSIRLTSHDFGTTIDISYKDHSPQEIAWLKKLLLGFERDGKIQYTKEKRSCHHFAVLPPNAVPTQLAQNSSSCTKNC